MEIKSRFNDIPNSSKIATTVGEFHSLRFRRSTTSISKSDNIIFTCSLALKSIPTVCTSFSIVLQTLKNGIVKGARQLTLSNIRVRVNNNGDTWVRCTVRLEERQILLVHNDHVGIRVSKYVSNIIFLETIVHPCYQFVSYYLTSKNRVSHGGNLPMLIAPAAAMPKIDSRKAGVLGHKMPTLVNPCFLM